MHKAATSVCVGPEQSTLLSGTAQTSSILLGLVLLIAQPRSSAGTSNVRLLSSILCKLAGQRRSTHPVLSVSPGHALGQQAFPGSGAPGTSGFCLKICSLYGQMQYPSSVKCFTLVIVRRHISPSSA